jgi:hypothetical protein
MAARGDRGRSYATLAHGSVESRLADAQEPCRLAGADQLRSPRDELFGLLRKEKPAMPSRSHHGRLQQAPRDGAQNRRSAYAETPG